MKNQKIATIKKLRGELDEIKIIDFLKDRELHLEVVKLKDFLVDYCNLFRKSPFNLGSLNINTIPRTIRQKILAVLEEKNKPLPVAEISSLTKINEENVRVILRELKKQRYVKDILTDSSIKLWKIT